MTRPGVRVVTRLAVRVVTRLAVRGVTRPGVRVVTRLAVRVVTRLAVRVVTRLGVRVATRLGVRVATRLGVRVATLAGALLLAASCSASPSTIELPIPPQPPPADGFDAGVFTLGVLVDLSGPAAEANRAALDGVQAYWAGVNARGGIAQLYSVELSVWDEDATAASDVGGAVVGSGVGVAAAREGGDGRITLEEWDVAALAYVHSGFDAAQLTADLPLPTVPAVATFAGEDSDWLLTSAAPVELTTAALLDRFRATGPGATWCVIVDSSPLGRQVASVAYAAGAAPDTVPATLDLDVGEIEVLDLDASVFDIADAVADRRCRYVLVETAESTAIDVLDRLPANLTVVRRSALAADYELPAHVELFIDPAPPWRAGRSAVMDALAADWSSLAAEAQPDPRARAGWLSQLRLHALLEEAAAGGDVSRERLVELSGQIEPVDPDRNTLPGVPRVGMDISEPVGGGPLRTLRLYGRSDVGADELGLRQVLVVDVTHLVEELRDRLGTLR
ncbi:hypothetical protein [Candidatus Poriferisodalis sp.]|uniref:hypothetical protein n=1 Tax=Candidatus Poriferisodalis sp. TaxID=3101277 RepID=UPI003B01D0C7